MVTPAVYCNASSTVCTPRCCISLAVMTETAAGVSRISVAILLPLVVRVAMIDFWSLSPLSMVMRSRTVLPPVLAASCASREPGRVATSAVQASRAASW
ncbi:hypothetical protein D3C86_1824450 [compost metagenome]